MILDICLPFGRKTFSTRAFRVDPRSFVTGLVCIIARETYHKLKYHFLTNCRFPKKIQTTPNPLQLLPNQLSFYSSKLRTHTIVFYFQLPLPCLATLSVCRQSVGRWGWRFGEFPYGGPRIIHRGQATGLFWGLNLTIFLKKCSHIFCVVLI